ncbi:MAG: carboxypeptidase regulatory-like domain-containing protein [Ardenticatenaceae bacterium]|nr:carboxypeptidase regulatory-like domain-containing protein [Ardenticatenaceae bacterium]
MSKFFVKFTVLLLLPLILAIVSFKTTRAQGVEVEPNSSCETAQDLGTITMPLTLDGELDISTTSSDIDFYQIRATPGDYLEVTLSGTETGDGTLYNPFLAVLSIDCNIISFGDDFNGSYNAYVTVVVPHSGVVILAATSCCDYLLTGNAGISGSYRLQVSQLPTIGSIQGRVVDGKTNTPMMFTNVTLNYCNGLECYVVRGVSTDENGRFIMSQNAGYLPLLAGDYQIVIDSTFYEPLYSEIFAVAVDEDVDLGDLALESLPLIDSISGQLIDAATNTPIINPTFHFAVSYAELFRCNESDCSEQIGLATLDENGRFRFDNDNLFYYNTPITAGEYRLDLTAATYESRSTNIFSVSVDEAFDLGELEMTPLPRAHSISGQLIDTFTHSPLPGNNYPYSQIELQKCEVPDNCYNINNQYVGDDGSFVIDTSYFGFPLLADNYYLRITAYEHQTKMIPIDLAEGEALNLGQILVDPEPIKLTNLQPCQDLPVRGGRCRFSIEITNRMTSRLNGIVWAVVDSYETGSFLNYTTFEIKNAQKVNLQTGRSKKVQFQVDIPATAGGEICVNIFVAQGTNNPFNTLGNTQFCVYKQSNVY